MDGFFRNGIFAATTLALATLVPQPVMAQQYTARTQHFEAEIVNLRRNAAGQVLATVIFRSRIGDPQRLTINSNADACAEAGSLTDGNGEDYPTITCINFYKVRWADLPDRGLTRPGMQIDGLNEASFVFRFETPLPTNESANQDINISIPIMYSDGTATGLWGGYVWRNVTLSFYGMQIPYSAARR